MSLDRILGWMDNHTFVTSAAAMAVLVLLFYAIGQPYWLAAVVFGALLAVAVIAEWLDRRKPGDCWLCKEHRLNKCVHAKGP